MRHSIYSSVQQDCTHCGAVPVILAVISISTSSISERRLLAFVTVLPSLAETLSCPPNTVPGCSTENLKTTTIDLSTISKKKKNKTGKY